jgi:hypothetical protein
LIFNGTSRSTDNCYRPLHFCARYLYKTLHLVAQEIHKRVPSTTSSAFSSTKYKTGQHHTSCPFLRITECSSSCAVTTQGTRPR